MASAINNGIPLVNGMLCSWADVVVLIGGVPVTGIVGVDYGDSQDVVNKWGGRPLSCGPCEREDHAEREADTVPGGGAGTVGTEPDGTASGPASVRHDRAVYPGQRHPCNGQGAQLSFFGQRPQMERGGHRSGGGASAGALTHRVGQGEVMRAEAHGKNKGRRILSGGHKESG